MKLFIPAFVLIGALAAAGAMFSASCATAPAGNNPGEVVLGCCGEPKPCDNCQCEDDACGDGCCSDATACGDSNGAESKAACCASNGAENNAACCKSKAAACASNGEANGSACDSKKAGCESKAKCCKAKADCAEKCDSDKAERATNSGQKAGCCSSGH